jgi:Tfp pilus assembly protein PilF
MKKTVSLVLAALLSVVFVTAQNVADGIKYITYGKDKSALETLQKAYNANSKDPQTIYWYGQAMLAQEPKNIQGAKALYQKALQEGVNDAWIWVGLGHVELLEGADLNSAKQKFEQAITATTETKGKNKGKLSIPVVAAIARANADGSSKVGDPNYAIEKVKLVSEYDRSNADMFVCMGILYQKLGGEMGGEAVKAYTEATSRDPKNADAFWHIGMVYSSQNNKEQMEQYFANAVAADAAYPKVYISWFKYYQNRDVNRAKEYIDKYIQYADKDCQTDYFYTDYLFRAGKYQESLDKTKAMEASDCKTYVMLPILYAFNYDRLGDSVQAKSYLEKFFATAPIDKIEPVHFELAVKVFSKFPGMEATTAGYLQKAIDNDTSKENKLKYYKQGADMFAKAKMFGEQVKWLQKLNDLKGTMSEFDYYTIVNAAFNAKDYALTMTLAGKYITAFPDKPNGYGFNVRAARAIDTANNTGVLFNAVVQQNQFLMKDTAKNKQILINNYYTMLSYYNDALKDYPKALEVCDSILVLIPGDPQTLKIKDLITKNMNNKNRPPATPTPPAKPATKGTTSGTGTAKPPSSSSKTKK